MRLLLLHDHFISHKIVPYFSGSFVAYTLNFPWKANDLFAHNIAGKPRVVGAKKTEMK